MSKSSFRIGVIPKHFRSVFSDSNAFKQNSDFGKSVTDTSTYKPDISLVRAFLGSAGNYNKKFIYDYPDGKDDGESVRTMLRSPGLDITEVETAEKVITQIVKDKAQSDKLSADAKKAQQDIIDAINSAKDSLSNGKGQDSTKESQESTK